HAAQKSTSTGTGTRAFWAISFNSSGSTSKGSFTGGSAVLHAPQRPVSDKCFAGIRFLCPQLLQVRIKGIPDTSRELFDNCQFGQGTGRKRMPLSDVTVALHGCPI